jgi:hypothetical protein
VSSVDGYGDFPVDSDSTSGGGMGAGDGVSFRMTTNPRSGRVDLFAASPAHLPDKDVKQIQGRLRRAESKPHAFVEDVFVPPHMVKTVPEHIDEVGVVAVYARHPVKEGYSWRAVRVSAAS